MSSSRTSPGAGAGAAGVATAISSPPPLLVALAVALLGLATVAYMWRQIRLNDRARREILREVERESRKTHGGGHASGGSTAGGATRRRGSGATAAPAPVPTATLAPAPTAPAPAPAPVPARAAAPTHAAPSKTPAQAKPRADRSLSLPAAVTPRPPVVVEAAAPAATQPDAAAGVEPRPSVRFAETVTFVADTPRAKPAPAKPRNPDAPNGGPAAARAGAAASGASRVHGNVLADMAAAIEFLDVRELRQLADATLSRLEATDAWETVDKGAVDTSRATLQARLKAAEQTVQDLRSEATLFRANSEQLRTARDRLEKELRAKEAAWQDRLTKAEQAAKAAEERMVQLRKQRDALAAASPASGPASAAAAPHPVTPAAPAAAETSVPTPPAEAAPAPPEAPKEPAPEPPADA